MTDTRPQQCNDTNGCTNITYHVRRRLDHLYNLRSTIASFAVSSMGRRATAEQLPAEAEAHSLKGEVHKRRDQDEHRGKQVKKFVKVPKCYVSTLHHVRQYLHHILTVYPIHRSSSFRMLCERRYLAKLRQEATARPFCHESSFVGEGPSIQVE